MEKINFDMDYIQLVTKLTKTKRKELIRYFEGLFEETKPGIFKETYQDMIIHKNLRKRGCNTELLYLIFLKSVSKFKGIETATRQKKRLTNQGLDQLKRIKSTRISERRITKSRDTLRKTIENEYIGLIRGLKKEGLGWGKISLYLARYHKINVSHVYLYKIYSQLNLEPSATDSL